MAFIETQITPEIIQKYDMQQDYEVLENSSPKDFYTYGEEEFWGARVDVYRSLKSFDMKKIIIDEEKNYYLRCGCMGFNEIFGVTGHTYFLLYWQKQRIYFIIKTDVKTSDEKYKQSHCELHLFQVRSLQPIIVDGDLYQVIEDTLSIYYENVHNWTYINTFNFNLIK